MSLIILFAKKAKEIENLTYNSMDKIVKKFFEVVGKEANAIVEWPAEFAS